MGLLKGADFVARRSQTLIDDPGAKLDQSYEIDRYLSALDDKYLAEISGLAQTENQSLSDDVRVIVTIIASHEESRIRRALDTYVKQDLETSRFEIIVLDNRKAESEADNTLREIEKFQHENPSISLIYAEKLWRPDEIASVGNARKLVFDIALARIRARGEKVKDTIIVSNDADTIDISSNYLSAILEKFDTDNKAEALSTPSVVPFSVISKPNMYATLYLWDAIDDVISQSEPRNLIGASSAVRVSIYAAVGGFNPQSRMAEDTELGFMIADARGWNPGSVILLDQTKLTTDPRRMLESMASRIPVNEMYYKFVSSPEVRNADNDGLLAMIPDTLDWELLEEDIDSFWDGGDTGICKWRGKQFESDFKSAMDKIGLEYRIAGGRLYLTNADKLLSNYVKEFGQEPEISHSIRRTYDGDRIRDIKKFFATVSDSAIECRNRVAETIKPEIERLISQGDIEEADKLTTTYNRFSWQPYRT